MSNIGKKVKITGGYGKYIGQVGVIASDKYDTLVETKMPDGETIGPWIKGNGVDCGDHEPEAEWVEESYIGRRVKLDNKSYAGEMATIVTEQVMSNGHTLWEVETESGSPRRPWASINTDPLYRQCELLPEETTTSTNNQNQSTMNTQSNTQAPETFYITSQYPEIMKVFWEEMKKVGYSSKSEEDDDLDWKRILHNKSKSTTESKTRYMDMYISAHGHPGAVTAKTHYQLPQQWEAALKHITDAAKYWEEVEKKPVYKTGEWVVIVEHQNGDPVGTVTQIVRINGDTLVVKNMDTKYSVVKTWEADSAKVRPATPQEIEEATRYKVGEYVVITDGGSGITAAVAGKSRYGADTGGVVKITGITDTGGNASKEDPRYYGENWNLRGCDIRRATAKEIAAAQTQTVTIGTDKRPITIKNGSIIADGKGISPNAIKSLITNMIELTAVTLPWAIQPTIDIAPTCSRGVKGVTLAELEEIVRVYDKLTKN